MAAFALAGCSDVVSIAPAVTDAEAIEVPAIVGRWHPVDSLSDTSRVDVRRLDGPSPRYLVEYWNFHVSESGEVAHPPGPYWYDARIGRVGTSLLMEVRPAMKVDSLLIAADDAYNPSLEATYLAFRIEVDSTRLRVLQFNPDSVQAAIRSGRCPGSYYQSADSRGHMVLTGSPAQVRAIWACAGELPGFLSELIVLERQAEPTSLPAKR